MVKQLPLQLNFIICGAGICGLSTAIAIRRAGHNVTVLEAAKQLKEVGAGIQLPPNSTRVLGAWGLLERFKEKVVSPSNCIIKKYATGKAIGEAPLNPEMAGVCNYPYWLIHRADYLMILYEAAVELGAIVVTNAKVDSVNDALVTVTLENGEIYKGDVIIGADGVNSKVRETVIPNEKIVSKPTEYKAYRAVITGNEMRSDPDTSLLLDNHYCICWIGVRYHIMGYPIRNGELYNLVLSYPGEIDDENSNISDDVEKMKKLKNEFEPLLQKIFTNITSCLKLKLNDFPPLGSWVSPNGKICLAGDAVHSMLPYLAQGAAQAVEDAATLGTVFSNIQSKNEIPFLLHLYEKIRKSRAEEIQKISFEQGVTWHMPNGGDQIARDIAISAVYSDSENIKHSDNPYRLSDPYFRSWLFEHDAITHAKEKIAEAKRLFQIETKQKDHRYVNQVHINNKF